MSEGNDWREVEPGTQLTAGQSARRFLSLSWDEQVSRMAIAQDAMEVALRCRGMNHSGLERWERTHRCSAVSDDSTSEGGVI